MRGSGRNNTDVGSNFLNFSLGPWNFHAKQGCLPAPILHHSDDTAYFLSSNLMFSVFLLVAAGQ
jgi:hypothetical protein